MKRNILLFRICLFSCFAIGLVAKLQANQESEFSAWQLSAEKNTQDVLAVTRQTSEASIVDIATHFSVDLAELRALLLGVEQSIVISLPLPDASLLDFELSNSNSMAPALAQKYPAIKTFQGIALNSNDNNELITGRFDITPNGFHGMFSYQGDTAFVEPSPDGEDHQYISYFRSNAQANITNKNLIEKAPKSIPDDVLAQIENTAKKSAQTGIRTYRFAVSAAAEYTQFHGGTKSSALAEIVTMVNRLNQIFERDLSVNLQLVADNDELIFVDAMTDPFSNSDNDEAINTEVISDIIGVDSYDIGHVVGTGGGGLATVGGVCLDSRKGNGVTGSASPTNDSFYIDYVAHEVGHQFNANHSFNGTGGGCSGNRISSHAYEPGSGSTIMAYAGICGSENLQTSSDEYFHSSSISVIETFIESGRGANCGTVGSETNNHPVVEAGDNYTIPANSAFTLTGSATDSDSSNLSYSWEQYDLGLASFSANSMIDDGTRPIFRAFNPVSEPTRTLPKLTDVLAGTTTKGESYATTDRTLNFRLLVRDSEGGVNYDDMAVNVVNTNEVFELTEPSVGSNWQTNEQTITWNVAGTDGNTIDCGFVDIRLSSDNGDNFTHSLALQTPNDGSHEISLSGVTTSQARVKISCSDNIFFAVNNGAFSIDVAAILAITSQETLSIEQGESITLTPAMFSYQDLSALSLLVSAGDNYTVSNTTVTPDASFSGTLSVAVVGVNGSDQSDVFVAQISVTEAPVTTTPTTPTPTVTQTNTTANTTTNESSSGAGMWLFLLLSCAVIVRKFDRNI
ncbi:reprolysin-like metallopeptidase [Thalassotalea sp. PLHSN55]|uniref:reprolysin-like metallopeptidase n=1 Tax=Thalassotalea sp. PLHSN55 TaxID=3435888 RepID=UPI003F83E539